MMCAYAKQREEMFLNRRATFGRRMLRCLFYVGLSLATGNITRRPLRLGWARAAVSSAVAGFSSSTHCSAATASSESTECNAAIEATIQDYLQRTHANGKFHIHGWRWHTMSLVREARRLQNLVQRVATTTTTSSDALVKAVDYVVGFNMKGLHRIESDLFFPWMRKTFQKIPDAATAQAFDQLLDRLDQDRTAVANIGATLVRPNGKLFPHVYHSLISFAPAALCKRETVGKVGVRSQSEAIRMEALQLVKQDASAMEERTREMLRLQETLLVPAIARLVSESEQKSFNSKVIRSLGILDSRMHLVGMYEAVWELDNEVERQLFQESIPYVPRMLIPRWRRLLYGPMAGVLDLAQSP